MTMQTFRFLPSLALCLIMITSCTHNSSVISPATVSSLQNELTERCSADAAQAVLIERGVSQAAALWTADDGSEQEFCTFVRENYCDTDSQRLALFESLSRILENIYQSADLLTVDLLKPTQLTNAS